MANLSKYGFSAVEVKPQGSGANGVMILGEAPGEEEDKAGIPFSPWAPAGSVLERSIRRLGLTREQFVVTNVVPFRPPNNWLEGAPWEAEAIETCRPFLELALQRFAPKAVITLGGVATRVMTELAGPKLGITNLTGFVVPAPRYNLPVVPCFHPSYLRRGAMSHFGLLMNSIRLAIKVAREGRLPILPPTDAPPSGYIMYPTEAMALEFEQRATSHQGAIAYDIETPYSDQEDIAEEAEGEQTIKSIQFSLARDSGIFLPWRPPFSNIGKRVLALPQPKLSWNGWRFDDPVLISNGAPIAGERHDLMWAWHHLQPDIPRGLQFAAGQLGWPWPWKHLDKLSPQFYGIVDVDVLQWMAR